LGGVKNENVGKIYKKLSFCNSGFIVLAMTISFGVQELRNVRPALH
jgi:hypothetical protein